jgi:hypothetical protein
VNNCAITTDLISKYPCTKGDAGVATTSAQTVQKRHLQPTPMYRVLRPVVSRVAAPRLGPNFLTGSSKEPIVLRPNSNLIQHIFEAESKEFTHCRWLEVNPDPERFGSARAFKDMEWYTNLVQRQTQGQTCYSTSGNKNSHKKSRAFIFVANIMLCRVVVIDIREVRTSCQFRSLDRHQGAEGGYLMFDE